MPLEQQMPQMPPEGQAQNPNAQNLARPRFARVRQFAQNMDPRQWQIYQRWQQNRFNNLNRRQPGWWRNPNQPIATTNFSRNPFLNRDGTYRIQPYPGQQQNVLPVPRLNDQSLNPNQPVVMRNTQRFPITPNAAPVPGAPVVRPVNGQIRPSARPFTVISPNSPAPVPRQTPTNTNTYTSPFDTNATVPWPERMDQLPLSLQVKRLWESLGYERQSYVERWVQPRFGSLLDTLTNERSFEPMMRIFDTEIIPRLRDQNMLRGWERPR